MSYAERMIQSNPSPAISGDALAECIRACFDCAQACTACADACLGEEDPKPLARCIRLDLDCADICDATGRILSRQTATDMQMVRATLQALRGRMRDPRSARHGPLSGVRRSVPAMRTSVQRVDR